MNDRRTFLKGAATAVAVAAVSKAGLATAAPKGMKNVIFTADNPGIWEGRAGSHAPEITVTPGGAYGRKVIIKTNHGMTEPHFIVRHTLVLADGTFVGGKVFTPKDEPESSYELPAGYSGKIYATSFCNLHDLWMSEISV